jgi:pentaxin family protein
MSVLLCLGAMGACSSGIELVSPAPDGGIVARPSLPANGGSGGDEPGDAGEPGGSGGGGGSGDRPPPDMIQPGAGGTSSGDDITEDAGPVPCADRDGDALCDTEDPCPDSSDTSTADADQDGTPDACDRCADQDDSRDVDRDGIPDACDPCGIHVALGLSPMFYFPLDEEGTASTAQNLGRVLQNASYIGPVTRGLAGVSDPAGRAVRMAGQQGGQFSRVSLLNALEFPSTALTTLFWVRTTQTNDISIISYAVQDSPNEFGIIVEGANVRVTIANSQFATTDVNGLALADGTWHFVAFTWQETSGQFYFDGVPVGSPLCTEAGCELDAVASVPVTGTLSIRPGGVLILGQDQDSLNGTFSATQALTGGLDEVAFYDRVLSEAEIQTIFQTTTCGERCDGSDNDGDGRIDEAFFGSAPDCAAPSCQAIQQAGAQFGTGTYFVTSAPGVPTTCAFE